MTLGRRPLTLLAAMAVATGIAACGGGGAAAPSGVASTQPSTQPGRARVPGISTGRAGATSTPVTAATTAAPATTPAPAAKTPVTATKPVSTGPAKGGSGTPGAASNSAASPQSAARQPTGGPAPQPRVSAPPQAPLPPGPTPLGCLAKAGLKSPSLASPGLWRATVPSDGDEVLVDGPYKTAQDAKVSAASLIGVTRAEPGGVYDVTATLRSNTGLQLGQVARCLAGA